MAIQTILISAANISKLCWGAKEKRPESSRRRKPLRDAIGLQDSSVLNSPQVRNGFEHFDEHLDEWAEGVLAGTTPSLYISRTIGPSIMPIAKQHKKPVPPMWGNYDPEKGKVEFGPRTVSIKRIIAAAEALQPSVRQVISGN
jgi:hypothetical protein